MTPLEHLSNIKHITVITESVFCDSEHFEKKSQWEADKGKTEHIHNVLGICVNLMNKFSQYIIYRNVKNS